MASKRIADTGLEIGVVKGCVRESDVFEEPAGPAFVHVCGPALVQADARTFDFAPAEPLPK